MDEPTERHLAVRGAVERELDLAFADLAALPEQVPDVGTVVSGREGGAVPLRAVLACAGVDPSATHVTLVSDDGSFAASTPLAEVADALLVYRLGEKPLPAGQGGPFRFLIPEAAACHTAPVDTCANVKFLGEIRLTVGPGRDTRPRTPAAHAALHRRA
jgi:DMSO/TMAO reductase YedYZ molybdopterin-dependent catalytic subunit